MCACYSVSGKGDSNAPFPWDSGGVGGPEMPAQHLDKPLAKSGDPEGLRGGHQRAQTFLLVVKQDDFFVELLGRKRLNNFVRSLNGEGILRSGKANTVLEVARVIEI